MRNRRSRDVRLRTALFTPDTTANKIILRYVIIVRITRIFVIDDAFHLNLNSLEVLRATWESIEHSAYFSIFLILAVPITNRTQMIKYNPS